jgi:hypothetical protein
MRSIDLFPPLPVDWDTEEILVHVPSNPPLGAVTSSVPSRASVTISRSPALVAEQRVTVTDAAAFWPAG